MRNPTSSTFVWICQWRNVYKAAESAWQKTVFWGIWFVNIKMTVAKSRIAKLREEWKMWGSRDCSIFWVAEEGHGLSRKWFRPQDSQRIFAVLYQPLNANDWLTTGHGHFFPYPPHLANGQSPSHVQRFVINAVDTASLNKSNANDDANGEREEKTRSTPRFEPIQWDINMSWNRICHNTATSLLLLRRKLPHSRQISWSTGRETWMLLGLQPAYPTREPQ
jgi:hypothetical protein